MRMETVNLEMTYKARTEQAVKVAYEDEEFWIPRSNLGYRTDKLIDDLTNNDVFTCTLFSWWAIQKGII